MNNYWEISRTYFGAITLVTSGYITHQTQSKFVKKI